MFFKDNKDNNMSTTMNNTESNSNNSNINNDNELRQRKTGSANGEGIEGTEPTSPQKNDMGNPILTSRQKSISKEIVTDFQRRLYKYGAFVLLVAQNSSIILVSRYQKKYYLEIGKEKTEDHDLVIITVGELLKFITCSFTLIFCYLFMYGSNNSRTEIQEKARKNQIHGLQDWKEIIAMCVPGAIYLVQNQLIFFSVSKLPGPIYQVSC